MNTLVIPDLHNQVDWVNPFIQWLETKMDIDEIVFVGDYFDSIGDSALEARLTAMWLKESMKDKKRKHCIGNHDMPYLLTKRLEWHWCPGFTVSKDKNINDVLSKADWENLIPAYYTQNYLISHAGFTARIFQHPMKETNAQELVKQAEADLKLTKAGLATHTFARGDSVHPAGITWVRWHQSFEPLVGINQIVGHTIVDEIRVKQAENSVNYCIDTNRKTVVLISDGVVSTINTNLHA